MASRYVVVAWFLLFVSVVGCRVLSHQSPVVPLDDQVHGQLVFHCDFTLPERHRLIREITSEREYISELLNIPASDEPIHIHLFRDGETFAAYTQARIPEAPQRRAFFVETDTRLIVYAHWSDHVAEDLRHEVAHGYLHASVGNLPLWIDEGLAEYFEVPRSQQGLNLPHVELLMDLYERDLWKPDLMTLASMEEFTAMQQRHYAEAWAWTHLLLETTPARRNLLHAYLADWREQGIAEPLPRRLAKLHHDPAEILLEHLRSLAAED